MPIVRRLLRYLAHLSAGRLVLWCYFIWWGVVLVRYFDPSPALWLTSAGLSLIIGTALLINTTASGTRRVSLEPWPTFRLFLTPFCVSSFSALVKGRGFFLIFSPRAADLLIALALCAGLWAAAAAARAPSRDVPTPPGDDDPDGVAAGTTTPAFHGATPTPLATPRSGGTGSAAAPPPPERAS